jgi:poly-gamma-glutamate capsule biosynthesis protein CapA/YwtB (metallophosphatase superfamily)
LTVPVASLEIKRLEQTVSWPVALAPRVMGRAANEGASQTVTGAAIRAMVSSHSAAWLRAIL